jgi:methyl-accepting chemotaxis protein-2 (aspartate sensor receptor)
MSFYNRLSLRSKILLPLIPTIFVIFVALGLYASSEIRQALTTETKNQLQVNIRLLSDMITTINTATINNADEHSESLIKICGGTSGFSLDEQTTVKIGELSTPTLSLHGTVMNLNTAKVEEFSSLYPGSVATLFARTGNDFARVTTSLKKEDGSRAVGTMLGEAHPAHKKLMNGESYHGIAKLFGSWYMTKYTPFKQGDTVIGALFVGTNINKDIDEFITSVQRIKVGSTGYAYVLDSKGTMLIHPSKAVAGKNVLDMKDANGKPLFKEMLEKKQGTILYDWKNADESTARQKISIFTSDNPWGWLIAASAYSTELYESATRIQWILLAAAVVCALLLAGLVVWILKSTLAPLQATSHAIARVAQGDLSVRLQVSTDDEIGAIQNDVNAMVTNLTEIMRQTTATAQDVSSAALQLQSTAGSMADNAEHVAGQVGSVATASEEMAATSNEIAMNCHQAVEAAKRANETAERGKNVVQDTVAAMGRIADRASHSATAVQSLGTRSDQIGAIVATIEDIADQTNLLALNAAIEAARAGEQGRGFAVVADEVRALAERTTRATREIGEMIKAIQTETRESVQAMTAAVEEVERGTADATSSGAALDAILQEIADVTMQINQIATAAEEQNATTGEITGNITRISDTVQETSSGAHQTATAASQLSELSGRLQQLVGRFRL